MTEQVLPGRLNTLQTPHLVDSSKLTTRSELPNYINQLFLYLTLIRIFGVRETEIVLTIQGVTLGTETTTKLIIKCGYKLYLFDNFPLPQIQLIIQILHYFVQFYVVSIFKNILVKLYRLF